MFPCDFVSLRLSLVRQRNCVKPELRNWGAHPPRVLLDAPRVQSLAWVMDMEASEISTRPMFSARAQKTAPGAGALPINLGIQVKTAGRRYGDDVISKRTKSAGKSDGTVDISVCVVGVTDSMVVVTGVQFEFARSVEDCTT